MNALAPLAMAAGLLALGVAQAAAPRELTDIKRGNRSFGATMVIDGAVYAVQARVTPSQGGATAVVALVDMKDQPQ